MSYSEPRPTQGDLDHTSNQEERQPVPTCRVQSVVRPSDGERTCGVSGDPLSEDGDDRGTRLGREGREERGLAYGRLGVHFFPKSDKRYNESKTRFREETTRSETFQRKQKTDRRTVRTSTGSRRTTRETRWTSRRTETRSREDLGTSRRRETGSTQ